jgi:hypothetical protein
MLGTLKRLLTVLWWRAQIGPRREADPPWREADPPRRGEDPYAWRPVPRKPRPNPGSAAVAVAEPDE